MGQVAASGIQIRQTTVARDFESEDHYPIANPRSDGGPAEPVKITVVCYWNTPVGDTTGAQAARGWDLGGGGGT